MILTRKMPNGTIIELSEEERTPCEIWSRVM